MSTPLSTALKWGAMGKIVPWKQPKATPEPAVETLAPEQSLPQQQDVKPAEAWVNEWKPGKRITHAMIVQTVCNAYSVTKQAILLDQRVQELVIPRHSICYLTRELTELPWNAIGRLMHRDHASIMHAWRKIGARRMTDTAFNTKITGIERQLQAMVQPDA